MKILINVDLINFIITQSVEVGASALSARLSDKSVFVENLGFSQVVRVQTSIELMLLR